MGMGDLMHKHQDKPSMHFEWSEVQKLPEEWTGNFDICVDKAFLDCVATAKSFWQDVPAVLGSVSRVLKPETGIYICFSHAGPQVRMPMLLGEGHSVEQDTTSNNYKWKIASST